MNIKHILVANGDKNLSQATVALLKSQNYQVGVSYSSTDTLEKANLYPDLILLERKLSDVDGLEICKQIRNNKRLRHISIIMLAENNTPAERVEGLCQGADDCITKPVDDKELIARIEAVLRRNQVFRQSDEKK